MGELLEPLFPLLSINNKFVWSAPLKKVLSKAKEYPSNRPTWKSQPIYAYMVVDSRNKH